MSEVSKNQRFPFGFVFNQTAFLLALTVFLAALSLSAEAQQPKKTARIGFLAASSASSIAPRLAAFRQGMRDLGYIEGQTLVIEERYAAGKTERQNALATELVNLHVDAIVTGGPTATAAAKQATRVIPIVMAQDFDPVTTGIVASLARPGGNVTGLATLYPEITGKQLELLKEIVPRLHRVTILGNSTVPGNSQSVNESKIAAETLGIRIAYVEVRRPEEIESVFSTAKKEQADAVLALASPLLTTYRKELVEFSLKSRLPTIYGRPEMVDDGGLMTYGVSVNDLFRRAATYVDKVLKGVKPTDLPIEQPTRFELLINLKTAKQIGVPIPQSVLFRADRVIR